jgi:hypothetical protein
VARIIEDAINSSLQRKQILTFGAYLNNRLGPPSEAEPRFTQKRMSFFLEGVAHGNC